MISIKGKRPWVNEKCYKKDKDGNKILKEDLKLKIVTFILENIDTIVIQLIS